MKPVSPVIRGSHIPEVNYAEDQPQYMTLPAIRTPDGVVLSRWQLTEKEKQQIAETGEIYLMVWTFNQPLQPVLLSVGVPVTFCWAEPPRPKDPEVQQ